MVVTGLRAMQAWVALAAVLAAGAGLARGATCRVATPLGCYSDSTTRLLNFTAAFETDPRAGNVTLEWCAELCCHYGFTAATDLVGVEYGAQVKE